MAHKRRKCNHLSIADKIKILDTAKSSEKPKNEVAKIFNIPFSTLSTVLKNESKIREQFSNGDFNRKRKRNVEFPDLEQAVITWFTQCRDNKINLSGVILRQKAEEFAKALGYNDFRASSGWLEKFKRRHDIVFRKICGESADVNADICDDWVNRLKTITASYKPEDILNADETG